LVSFAKSIVLDVSNTFMALSQAEAAQVCEIALMPISSGIPNNTYFASQVVRNVNESVSLVPLSFSHQI
jgi:hypothetical protein